MVTRASSDTEVDMSWQLCEDHINTGFVLVKPTQAIRRLVLKAMLLWPPICTSTDDHRPHSWGFLIADFLDENWQSEQGGGEVVLASPVSSAIITYPAGEQAVVGMVWSLA